MSSAFLFFQTVFGTTHFFDIDCLQHFTSEMGLELSTNSPVMLSVLYLYRFIFILFSTILISFQHIVIRIIEFVTNVFINISNSITDSNIKPYLFHPTPAFSFLSLQLL